MISVIIYVQKYSTNFKKSLLGRFTENLFQYMPHKVVLTLSFNGFDKSYSRN